MKIEVLMSACKVKKINDIIKNKNINNGIIVNQMMPSFKKNKLGNIIMYSYNEKGLSKSRNRLLDNMTGDIGIITDDDITFVQNYEKIIKKAYLDNKDADVILFNYCKGNKEFGGSKKFTYNSISILKAISFQITFRIESIKNNNLKFDEDFGIGATYSSGEENIFLKDCLDKNLKVIHIPICICHHPDELTTGEKWTEREIITKGAVSARLYKMGIIYKYYLVLTKYNKYKENFKMIDFIKLFNKGKKEYLKYAKR